MDFDPFTGEADRAADFLRLTGDGARAERLPDVLLCITMADDACRRLLQGAGARLLASRRRDPRSKSTFFDFGALGRAAPYVSTAEVVSRLSWLLASRPRGRWSLVRIACRPAQGGQEGCGQQAENSFILASSGVAQWPQRARACTSHVHVHGRKLVLFDRGTLSAQSACDTLRCSTSERLC